MAHVVVQLGHCYRSRGATGTEGEQVMSASVAAHLAGRLGWFGHKSTLVLADDRHHPKADVFVALHMDGSVHASASGASVGWRNVAGQRFAAAWKEQYQRHGWDRGFRPDNYTPGLASYYGTADAIRAGIPRAVIVEVGFGTNPTDRKWIDANHPRIAQSLVDAVGVIIGHPKPPKPETPPRRYDMLLYAKRGTVDALAALAIHSAAPRGVITSDLAEAKAAARRGERVIAVGGPAVGDLQGEPNVTAIRGATALDTIAQSVSMAEKGWS